MGRQWRSVPALSLLHTTGEADPVVAITALIERLIDEVGVDGPPVDLRMLASFQGVRYIRPTRMMSAGRLIPDGGALVIEVNDRHSPGKQNFSAAHEIVHTMFPTYSGYTVDDAETGAFCNDSEEEFLCDVGASALLLPDRWLRQIALDLGPALYTLLESAKLFEASLQATARKLAELDLWPCAFVLWEEGFRKVDRIPEGQDLLPGLEEYGHPRPKLRASNVYASQSFGHLIPKNKSVHDDSVVAECCNTEGAMYKLERFDLGHSIVDLHCETIWAPYRAGDTVRNRVISLLLPTSTSPTSLPPVRNYQFESL